MTPADCPAGAVSVLDGVRVLDMTTYLPGPYASLLLADLGADVIHVEPPGGDPARSVIPLVNGGGALHSWLSRNKRSVTVNLKDPDDYSRWQELVRDCDVVLEGFTPGVADRLRTGYQDVRAVNSRAVYCSVSGHGYGHSAAGVPAHDINLVARSGFLAQVAAADGTPAAIGPPVADIAGGLHAAVGILAALLYRERTGHGERIEVSLLASAIALAGPQLIKALAPKPLPPEEDWNRGADPGYRAYQARDGRWLVVGAYEHKFWDVLCAKLGRPDLAGRRASEPAEVAKELGEVFRSEDRSHWDALLEDAGVCYAPVHRPDEVAADPVVSAHRDIVTVGALPQPANPVRLPHRAETAHQPMPPPASGIQWRPRTSPAPG